MVLRSGVVLIRESVIVIPRLTLLHPKLNHTLHPQLRYNNAIHAQQSGAQITAQHKLPCTQGV